MRMKWKMNVVLAMYLELMKYSNLPDNGMKIGCPLTYYAVLGSLMGIICDCGAHPVL